MSTAGSGVISSPSPSRTTRPPLRTLATAACLVAELPAASIARSTPSPSVRVLIRPTVSSVRASIAAVAPRRRASSSLAGTMSTDTSTVGASMRASWRAITPWVPAPKMAIRRTRPPALRLKMWTALASGSAKLAVKSGIPGGTGTTDARGAATKSASPLLSELIDDAVQDAPAQIAERRERGPDLVGGDHPPPPQGVLDHGRILVRADHHLVDERDERREQARGRRHLPAPRHVEPGPAPAGKDLGDGGDRAFAPPQHLP